jgi:1-acyl-sn-glycerol-3-phosphate acyltransferase
MLYKPSWFYILTRYICRLYLYIFCGWKVYGLDNIPKVGGAIVASNHVSNLDPVVMGCAMPRKVCYLAKEELFINPISRWVCTQLGAFPVKRGAGDRGAIRESLKILDSGALFGIFPEGSRSKDGKLGEGKPGLAMIALKAKVPIIPVALINTNTKKSLRTYIGKPIYLDKYFDSKADRDVLQEIVDSLMNEIKLLTEEK